MSDNSFYETLSSLLTDVVDYLDELKGFKLTKEDIAKKSKLIDKINKTREDYPQLNIEKNNNVDKVSSESPSEEFYEDIGTRETNFKQPLKKHKSSPDLSENQSLSDDNTIRGFLIRKSAGKSKIGFVTKLKNIVGKKYCVVENGLFSIYDNASSKKPSSSFYLSGYEVKLPSGQNKELVFELICPGRKSYQFATGSKEELMKWTDSLKSEVLKKKGSNPSVGSLADKNEEDAYEDDAKDTYQNGTEADEELYDDIAAGAEETSVKPAKQEPPEDSDPDEIYDDIEESRPTSVAFPQQAKPPPAMPQSSKTPNKSTTLPISSSKSGIVSSKDGLPYDKMYYGKWDCSGGAEDELSFNRGDIMIIMSQEFDNFGWWVAELKGTVGLVPRDYLTPAYELVPYR